MGNGIASDSVKHSPRPLGKALLLIFGIVAVLIVCQLSVGLWLLYRLPPALFAALPRDRADDISAAVAKWVTRISPLLLSLYLAGGRLAWLRVRERVSHVKPEAPISLWKRKLGRFGVAALWVIAGLLALSSLASFFADPAAGAKKKAREMATEIGLPAARNLQRMQRPTPPVGNRVRVGRFTVIVPDAWPETEPAEVGAPEVIALRGRGVMIFGGSGGFLALDRLWQEERFYYASICYRFDTVEGLLDVLCTLDGSDVASADCVLLNLANAEMIVTLGLFWIDSAWCFPMGEDRTVFVLCDSRQNGQKCFSIILTDPEEGDMGGLLIEAEDGAVTEDEVLALAASMEEQEPLSAPETWQDGAS